MDPDSIPARIEALSSRGEASPWTGACSISRDAAQGRVEAARQSGAFDRGTDGFVVRDVSVGGKRGTLLAVLDGNYKHEPTAFAVGAAALALHETFESPLASTADVVPALRRAMHAADELVHGLEGLASSEPLGSFFTAKTTTLEGLGASATVALVLAPDIWVAHLGDTSAWLVHDDGPRRLTVDHTLAHEADYRSKAETALDSLRAEDVVVRVLGMKDSHRFDITRIEVDAGARVVLGTRALREVLARHPTSDAADLSKRGSQAAGDFVGAATCAVTLRPVPARHTP